MIERSKVCREVPRISSALITGAGPPVCDVAVLGHGTLPNDLFFEMTGMQLITGMIAASRLYRYVKSQWAASEAQVREVRAA